MSVSGKAGVFRRFVAAAIAAAAVAWVVTRLLAFRLRRRPDREAGEVIMEPLGERIRFVEGEEETRIYTEELGEGPTLLFVHGFFCNADNWHYQKKLMSDRYRILCLDHRGHRHSVIDEGSDCSIETLALDLKRVLDDIHGERPVVLIGHSMGGMSILKLAEMFPEMLGDTVKGVALVDTSHLPLSECMMTGHALNYVRRPVIEPVLRFGTAHPDFADAIKKAVTRLSLFLVATRYLGYGRGACLTHLEYIADMANVTPMYGICLAALHLLQEDAPISLAHLRDSGIPVMIWVGEQDKLTRPFVSEMMAAEIPGSELHVIEDTGHPSFMEEYARFNEALDDFASRAFTAEEESR